MKKPSDFYFAVIYLSSCLLAASPPAQAKSTIVPIDFSQQCFHGGFRKTTGTYDPMGGALELKITVTGCTDKDNSSHDGTITTTGSVTPGDTAGTFVIDTTKQYNTHDVNAGNDLKSICTYHWVGEFKVDTATFNGTVSTSDCNMQNDVVRKDNSLLEALKRAHQIK